MTTETIEKPKNKGGRPPIKGQHVQLNVRTQKRTRDRLAKQADRRGVSTSYMVEVALVKMLEVWEAEELTFH